MNIAKAKLLEGRPIISVNLGGTALPPIDSLARYGADVLFIDCERTPVSLEGAYAMARGAKAAGMTSVLRTHSKRAADIVRYIDCGVGGIVLPQVETPEECAELVELARYATKGHQDDLLLIAQIETVPAVERLDAIAACPGIDCLLIGPNDLAHAMGFLGDTMRSEVMFAIDGVTSRLAALRRPFGLPVTTASARDWTARGAQFLYTTLDQHIGFGLSSMLVDLPRPDERDTPW